MSALFTIQMKPLKNGLFTGLLLQMAIGPVYFFVANLALQKSLYDGLAGVLAVTLTDYLYITLALFGVGKMLNNKKIKKTFGRIGSILLVVFGILLIFGVTKKPAPLTAVANSTDLLTSFAATFILTLASPVTILFWTGIFATKAAVHNYSKHNLVFFGLGAGLSTPLFLGFSVIIFSLIKQSIPQVVIQMLNISLGCVLVIYGIMRLVKPPRLLYGFFHNRGEAGTVTRFLFKKNPRLNFRQRFSLIKRLYAISRAVKCPHTQHEIISFINTILSIPPQVKGCIVEAGCFKGGSTAKFSIASKLAGRRLIVFDSFEGLPEHDEPHRKNIFGGRADFHKGGYCGTLDEVKNNIGKFGEPDSCKFIKGWFDDTMPKFSEPIAAIYLDIDLASSTRTCLKYLYPLLVPGCILYSQDGHLPLVIDVFSDDAFWEKQVGCPKPAIEGLGKRKLIKIVKPSNLKKPPAH